MAGGLNGLKISLRELQVYLNENFSSDVVTKLINISEHFSECAGKTVDSGLLETINKCIEDHSDEFVGSMGDLADFTKLVKQKEIIQKFDTLLSKVNSIASLFEVSDFLQKHAQTCMYAYYGVLIFTPIINCALAYSQSKGHLALYKAINEQLQLLNTINISQTRQVSAQTLMLFHAHRANKLDYAEDSQRVSQAVNSARKFIDYAPDPDMQKLSSFAHQLVDGLYCQAENALDHVGQAMDPVDMLQALDGIPLYIQNPSPTELNLGLVKHHLGHKVINDLVDELSRFLMTHGADKIYSETIYLDGERSTHFRDRISAAVQASKQENARANLGAIDDGNLVTMIRGLLEVRERIQRSLQVTDQETKIKVHEVVFNAAIFSLCEQTAPYFRLPWNLKVELQAGLWDSVESMKHPIDALCDAFKTLNVYSDEGHDKRCALVYGFAERPVKTLTHVTTASAATIGLGVAAVRRGKIR